MKDASRRQVLAGMLADMGIDVWHLRVLEVGPIAEPAQPQSLQPKSLQPTATQPVPKEPATAVPATASVRATSAVAPTTRPWEALSLVAGDALLVVAALASRRQQRLARDLLAAASGDWGAQISSRRFRWPPEPAASQGTDGGVRAFRAFIDKDIGDHQVRAVLCEASLAERLGTSGDSTPARIVIADLEALGADGAAKRRLWRTLEDLRR